jgi:hypothetical protein
MARGPRFLRNSDRLPTRKPILSARRVSLFQRDVEIRLSSAAVDILFDNASVLSEGQVEGERFCGSTMITFDSARASHLVSDTCDAATVRRVSELVATDERIRDRARRLGAGEAERLAGGTLRNAQIDIQVRANGSHLHIDVDVEATPAQAAGPGANKTRTP